MKYFFPALIPFVSLCASAASGAEAHGDHVPVQLVIYQTINVVILIAGLIYFLREPVRAYFKEKRATYLSAAHKAQAARQAAEDERSLILSKLTKLENSADESVDRARAEAADLKRQLIAEAETLSQRIRAEAQESARMEVEKAKRQLREELIKESLEIARTQLSTKVTAEDHKRLQSDFVSHIQGVQK